MRYEKNPHCDKALQTGSQKNKNNIAHTSSNGWRIDFSYNAKNVINDDILHPNKAFFLAISEINYSVDDYCKNHAQYEQKMAQEKQLRKQQKQLEKEETLKIQQKAAQKRELKKNIKAAHDELKISATGKINNFSLAQQKQSPTDSQKSEISREKSDNQQQHSSRKRWATKKLTSQKQKKWSEEKPGTYQKQISKEQYTTRIL